MPRKKTDLRHVKRQHPRVDQWKIFFDRNNDKTAFLRPAMFLIQLTDDSVGSTENVLSYDSRVVMPEEVVKFRTDSRARLEAVFSVRHSIIVPVCYK